MLLKVILFLVVVYYIWKLMFRLFFPVVAKKVVEKAQKNMEDRMRQAQDRQSADASFQEGEVVIQKGAEKKAGVSDAEGDYVEFEEIKE
ncbi:MAG: hypothetical protein ACI9UR_000826 [Bacteroidia bacterium]|jgi:hypothetical protein